MNIGKVVVIAGAALMLAAPGARANFLPSAVNGNIGIGTTAPAQKLDVAGTVRATPFSGNGAGLTGISGTVSGLTATAVPYAASPTTLVDSGIYVGPGGNVGIGSASPGAALDVSGKGSIGTLILPPAGAVVLVAAGSGVGVAGNSFIRIAGSGGPVDITPGVTQVAAGSDGQELVLYGTSDTHTVKFHNGDGLELFYGVSFTLGQDDTLRLIYSAAGGFWREISRSN